MSAMTNFFTTRQATNRLIQSYGITYTHSSSLVRQAKKWDVLPTEKSFGQWVWTDEDIDRFATEWMWRADIE